VKYRCVVLRFRPDLRVCGALLDLGLPEKDVQRMTRDNLSYLIGLD
jgi:hypothetical protein